MVVVLVRPSAVVVVHGQKTQQHSDERGPTLAGARPTSRSGCSSVVGESVDTLNKQGLRVTINW